MRVPSRSRKTACQAELIRNGDDNLSQRAQRAQRTATKWIYPRHAPEQSTDGNAACSRSENTSFVVLRALCAPCATATTISHRERRERRELQQIGRAHV